MRAAIDDTEWQNLWRRRQTCAMLIADLKQKIEYLQRKWPEHGYGEEFSYSVNSNK